MNPKLVELYNRIRTHPNEFHQYTYEAIIYLVECPIKDISISDENSVIDLLYKEFIEDINIGVKGFTERYANEQLQNPNLHREAS